MTMARTLATTAAVAALAALAACASGPQAPVYTAENTLVVPPIVYGTTEKGDALSEKDDNCDTPGTLRLGVQWSLPYPLVHEVDVAPPGVPDVRTLKLEIVDILANAGGQFSGPKMLTVKGTLSKAGTKVAGFTAVRWTFPVFPPRTTCNMMGRITERLGNDIGTWLTNPVDGVTLGNH
jgi:hypothetical protein